MSLLATLRMPVRFKRFYADFRDREFDLLDVGCGFNSPAKTKTYFPRCRYSGIDRDADSLDENDLRLMERFYKIDLDAEPLDEVPDGAFDVVILSHIIEHLRNGTKVLGELAGKLRPGGVIYVEFPGLRSFSAPHARGDGCSHFCDDPTHVRAYTLEEVINALLDQNLTIIKAGTRRDPTRLLLSPVAFAAGLARGSPWDRQLWDWFGFAEYVYARRPAAAPVVNDPAGSGAGLSRKGVDS